MAVQHKALLYSMFSSWMAFRRVNADEGALPPSSLELHVTSHALSCLRQQMSHPVTAVHEANLWAVIVLAYRGSALPIRSGKLPRQSFLKELQELNVYGRMRTDDAHKQGLISLLQLHGGVEKLKTPGIASSITLLVFPES